MKQATKNNNYNIHWTNVPPVCGKISAANIITPQPEVKLPYQNCLTQSQCFDAFIDDEIINNIVTYTNAKLQSKIDHLISKNVIILPCHQLHHTNAVEMRAGRFFSLCQLCGQATCTAHQGIIKCKVCCGGQ